VAPPTPWVRNTIDKFPFATNANATDVGDLSVARRAVAGQSSTTTGYSSGGEAAPAPPFVVGNTIDSFPFATDANASDVGDISVARSFVAGQSSTTFGYTSGGITPAITNVIDRFPFSSNANASDVGDLSVSRSAAAGQQV
jgi:hypothetical protein